MRQIYNSIGINKLNHWKKNLEQREKSELIAIIQHMLSQEPELQWLLITPLPTALAQKSSVDPKVYREQVLAAIAAGENQRKRKHGNISNFADLVRLTRKSSCVLVKCGS